MINKDVLWKGIIEDLVEEFVHFFFPDFVDEIDFTRGFTFLDKELQQISPQSSASLRRADKLFKAWLKTGRESWFLVHVEVQAYSDPDFAKRMFEYVYRIMDRFQRPVTALVIYTDTNRKYHFNEYRYSFFGTELSYRFRTFILMDCSEEMLLASKNIFGLALETARRELVLRRQDDLVRLETKTDLVKRLFRHGIPNRKIRYLLDFIGTYIQFENSEFLLKFEEKIEVISQNRRSMGIREAILQDVREQKELIMVTRAWKKGISPEDIAYLADMELDKVKIIIEQLEQQANADSQ